MIKTLSINNLSKALVFYRPFSYSSCSIMIRNGGNYSLPYWSESHQTFAGANPCKKGSFICKVIADFSIFFFRSYIV